MNYNLQCQQFSTQFLDDIKNAEDVKIFDELSKDFKTQNNEMSEMFMIQDKEIKDMEPCLVSLERTHKQNSDLLEPIEHLTDEVYPCIAYYMFYLSS